MKGRNSKLNKKIFLFKNLGRTTLAIPLQLEFHLLNDSVQHLCRRNHVKKKQTELMISFGNLVSGPNQGSSTGDNMQSEISSSQTTNENACAGC